MGGTGRRGEGVEEREGGRGGGKGRGEGGRGEGGGRGGRSCECHAFELLREGIVKGPEEMEGRRDTQRGKIVRGVVCQP